MNKYKNKRITIIGLGRTGISCINFFNKKKSNIYIMDCKKNINIDNIDIPIEKISLGSLKISWILVSDLIVLSPGVPFNTPEILIAKLYNLDIVNDIEIFCREIKNKNKKIIAITGSNGKSSVVTLIYKIIKKKYKKVIMGGNIGIPILNLLNKNSNIYILELSSFQLELITSLNFTISVILNISRNHIDRHISFDNYKNIKLKIYNNSLNCIFNIDDNNTFPINNINSKNISFGLFKGNYHLLHENNIIFLCNNNKKLLNCNNLKIHGYHFYLNSLVAIAVTDLFNIPLKIQINILKNFNGLDHRLKLIKINNKIKWINDSKSTNPNSTIVAINSIKKFNYLHLLIGGNSKSNDFCVLSNFIKYKNVLLYFFGKDGIYISKFFYNYSIYKENLLSLIIIINKISLNGDVVLLSPSCSSTDQYTSFEKRGDFFIKHVNYIICKKNSF